MTTPAQRIDRAECTAVYPHRVGALTEPQRQFIRKCWRDQVSARTIARSIGKAQSTVSDFARQDAACLAVLRTGCAP